MQLPPSRLCQEQHKTHKEKLCCFSLGNKLQIEERNFLLPLKQEEKSVSKHADVRVEGNDFVLAFKTSLLGEAVLRALLACDVLQVACWNGYLCSNKGTRDTGYS